MSERGETLSKSPEEAGESLVAFAEQAVFGPPEFHALCDYFDQQNLLGTYQQQLKIAEHPGTGEFSGFKMLSRVRTTEMQIALLEHHINQSKTTVPGYGKSFQIVEAVFDKLGVDSVLNPVVDVEADEAELYEFSSNSYQKYHMKVEEIIYKKRDAA